MSYLDSKAASGMSSLFQALETNTRIRINVLVAAVGVVATVVVWILHWRFPYVVLKVMEHDSKILMLLVFAAAVAPPFCIVYSVGSILRRRAGEPAAEESGLMSGYFYREQANKEWKLLMLAGFFGGLNFLLMIISSGSL